MRCIFLVIESEARISDTVLQQAVAVFVAVVLNTGSSSLVQTGMQNDSFVSSACHYLDPYLSPGSQLRSAGYSFSISWYKDKH